MSRLRTIPISAVIAEIHRLAFAQSVARVRNLISIYRKHLSPTKSGRRAVHATDIAEVLNACGIDVAELNKFFPVLDEMIQRRHHIVHRGDKDPGHHMVSRPGEEGKIRGHHVARSLSVAKIEHWMRTTEGFARKLLDLMSDREYGKQFKTSQQSAPAHRMKRGR